MSGDATVGAVVGAISSAAQTAAAAKTNRQNRAFSDYQRRTAFQVQRRDLELAGYNPLYAFHGSGSGATGYNPTTFNLNPDLAGNIGKGVSAGVEHLLSSAQHAELRNRAGLQNAQANLASAKGATETSTQNMQRQQTRKLEAETFLLNELRPAATTAADIDRSKAGKFGRQIERAIQTFGPLLNIRKGGKRR